MYFPHPSQELNSIFQQKPYQGINPDKAKFLFIGLDANYKKDIEASYFFNKIVEYLSDGVKFWETFDVHHPFLLPEYKGDGRFYHKSFSRIGFTKENASEVSFVELLHLPTYGRSNLELNDLDKTHLSNINKWILEGEAEYIFIPTSVAKLMQKTNQFDWIPSKPIDNGKHLKLWTKIEHKKIYWHYHFSVYGKFEEKKTNQLNEIGSLIN